MEISLKDMARLPRDIHSLHIHNPGYPNHLTRPTLDLILGKS